LQNVINHIVYLGCFCFSDINISQGSVATRLRCDGMFYDSIAGNLLLSLLVKEFWKLASTGKVRGRNKMVPFFSRHSVFHYTVSLVDAFNREILSGDMINPF